MGKDRAGVFHPKKGRPTDDSKESLDLPEDKMHLLHPNRNTQKKREQHISKQEDKKQAAAGGNEAASDKGSSGTVAQELPYRMDKRDLESLAQTANGRCISIYLPASKVGEDVNEMSDSIAFKNMLQQAEEQLKKAGSEQHHIDSLLQPGLNLVQDETFWHTQLGGLAFFSTDGFSRYVKLPEAPLSELTVNDHFMLTPLIPFMAEDFRFYVLTISKHHVQLFRGDQFGMSPVTVPGMPRGMDDVVHFEEKDEAGVFRTGGGTAGTSANFHGIGGGKPDEKESIALYFTEVAKTLNHEVLVGDPAPLLLAGVDYLHPIYVRVSHYKQIIPEGLLGNYDRTSTPDLYRQAREKLQPAIDQQVQRHLDEYYNKSSGALTNSIPSELIAAAFNGQIGRLFIEKDAHIWGSFDPVSQQVQIHDEKQPPDECLINQAAIQTLLNGGYVHILPKERMPPDAVMAALLRYP